MILQAAAYAAASLKPQAESQIGIYGAADAAQIENGKCKIENGGVRFAQDLKSFLKEIPSFSTFNFQLAIFNSCQRHDELKFEQEG